MEIISKHGSSNFKNIQINKSIGQAGKNILYKQSHLRDKVREPNSKTEANSPVHDESETFLKYDIQRQHFMHELEISNCSFCQLTQ